MVDPEAHSAFQQVVENCVVRDDPPTEPRGIGQSFRIESVECRSPWRNVKFPP